MDLNELRWTNKRQKEETTIGQNEKEREWQNDKKIVLWGLIGKDGDLNIAKGTTDPRVEFCLPK